MVKSVQQNKSKGFTIVELLVVIVVIGILAVITIIGYTGVTQRAAAAALESDLKNAATSIELYKVEHNGEYPSSADELPKSGDTVYQYTVEDGVYYLSATSPSAGTTAYHISSTSGSVVAGVWENHTPPAGTPMIWKQISTGGYHTCGIASDNKAYCWGSAWDGQLGYGSQTQSLTPVAVDMTGVLSGKTILAISAGSQHTCAIASDNLPYCWGDSYYGGQLGNGSSSMRSLVPVAVDTSGVLSGKTVKSIFAGSANHTCVIASDDKAYCWGSNSFGQLGNSSTTNSSVPVAVNTAGVLSGKTVKNIVTGNSHTCVIASDDLAYCWGAGGNGRLGNNSTSNSSVPVAVYTAGVLSGKTIKSIDGGSAFTCAVASDNLAYCWGYNNNGQLGNNSTTQSSVPVAVNTAGVLSGKTVKSVAAYASINASCVIASDDQAYCWGQNSNGQLGNNSTTQSLVPVAVNTAGALNGKTVKSLSPSSYHTCAVASDNLAYCWGYNSNGQLGNNSTTNSTVPVLAHQIISQ